MVDNPSAGSAGLNLGTVAFVRQSARKKRLILGLTLVALVWFLLHRWNYNFPKICHSKIRDPCDQAQESLNLSV